MGWIIEGMDDYMNYKNYLSGSHWRNFRKRALEHHGMKCADCGEENVRFDIHHLTYERFGKEELSDVVVLCHNCHHKRHKTEVRIYDMRPYLCEHKTLTKSSTYDDVEMFFMWQCVECHWMVMRMPSEKEILRAKKKGLVAFIPQEDYRWPSLARK